MSHQDSTVDAWGPSGRGTGMISVVSGAEFWEYETSPPDCPQPKDHQPGWEPTEQVPDPRGRVLVWGTEVRTAVLNAVAINTCLTFRWLNMSLDIPGKRDSQ